jgi:hypothetical protein
MDKKTAGHSMLHVRPLFYLLLACCDHYFVAGAAGAAGAGAGAGAASGAGAGAGAGAAVSAGFCSSAFLQPTTANDNVTKKSMERIIANTFFINMSPPFADFKRERHIISLYGDSRRYETYSLFLACQDNFRII